MKWFSPSPILSFFWLIVVLSLQGCANIALDETAILEDDGKRNIVLIESDLSFDTVVKPRNQNAFITAPVPEIQMNLECSKGVSGTANTLNSLATGNACLTLPLVYTGEEYVYRTNKPQLFKLEYGSYTFTGATLKFNGARSIKLDCSEDPAPGEQKCKQSGKTNVNFHSYKFDRPVTINVASGAGCYFGKLTMQGVDGQLDQFDYTQADYDVSTLSAEQNANIRAHISRPC